MKKFLKRAVCIVLMLSMFASMAVCFAATEDKQYRHYDKLVQLGDSAAAGFDEEPGKWVNTEFNYVEHSYPAIVAKALGAECIPLACQGFRTIEMRYMLEDDFVGDSYLFHDTYDIPRTEALKPYFREQIADADIITLGLGGNDVGTYLSWVVIRALEKDSALKPFCDAAKEMLANLGITDDPIYKLIELADTMGKLPELLKRLPEGIAFGVSNYLKNWNIVMDDIYALNPDVTMVVAGLFDTGYKNEADLDDNSTNAMISHAVAQTIVDAINAPMKQNADKYGYIYVEMDKIICLGAHPTRPGYAKMAETILAALPEADFAYDDVFGNDWYYEAVKFVTNNKFMNGVSDKLFAPKDNITRAQLVETLYKLAGSPDVSGMKEPFLDINKKSACYNAVVWAYNNGIVTGMTNRFFNQAAPATRAQLVTMLYRLAGSPAVNGELKYIDKYSVPSYAKNAVIWANENDVANGYNNKFRPLAPATRAEVAAAVMNYCAL